MTFITSEYKPYTSLIEEIGIEKINDRYNFLHAEIDAFINRLQASEKLKINERVLMHSVLEYFEDIGKVKSAHKLEHANGYKVMAYSAYWLLRRQPIQILTEDDSDESLIFANEKFVLSMLVTFLMKGSENTPLIDENLKAFRAFLNTFFYYLKFRKPDAQSIEMILLSFGVGKYFRAE